MLASTIHLPVERQLSIAVRIFIKLRWFPPVVIAAGSLLMKYYFGFNLNVSAMMQISLSIIICNFYLYWRDRSQRFSSVSELLRSANLHIFFDYFSITLLVYYTGGVLSPVIWFYTIHIITTCIFFKRRKVIWMTVALWLVLLAMFLGEYSGWLEHQEVYSPDFEGLFFRNFGFLFAVLAGAAVLWSAVIWLLSMIIKRVRTAEKEERELQNQFKRIADELTESEKRQLVYRRLMTHELRSPIAASQSIVRVMLSGTFGPLTEAQSDGVLRVTKRLDQLQEMLQDLLTLERTNREGFKPAPVPLAPLIESLINIYHPQIEEHRLQLALQLDPTAIAKADPDDVSVILSNVISNAIKYSRDGGALRIATASQPATVVIEIQDSGIGIPQKEQAKLFKEFFRAGNAKRQTVQGTGLGLAIVQKFVQKNNGVIHLESEEHVGTVVSIALPRATENPTDCDSDCVG